MRPGGVKTIAANSPVSFTQLGNQQSVAWVGVINDSPYTVLADFGNGAADYIPAYQVKYYATADLGFQWFGALNVSVVSVPSNVSNAPSSDIAVALYSPGEQLTPAAVGISRSLVSVADIVAQFLEGDAQALKLTEVDDPNGFPVLGPPSGANIGMGLGGNDSGNVFRTILEIHTDGSIEATVLKHDGSGNFGDLEAGNYYIGGAVKLVDSLFTAGLTGVPAILAKQVTTGITSTAAQTIINYAPTVTGLYRLNVFIRLNNSVSGNNLTITVTYHNAFSGGSDTKNLTFNDAAANLIAAGATSFANRGFPGIPVVFYADSGANIQLSYRDPTNTPNDSVAAYLEFLG